jgi:hypothetical protein
MKARGSFFWIFVSRPISIFFCFAPLALSVFVATKGTFADSLSLDAAILTAHFKSLVIIGPPHLSEGSDSLNNAVSAARWPSSKLEYELYSPFEADQPDEAYLAVKEFAQLGATDSAGLDIDVVRTTPKGGPGPRFGHGQSNVLMLVARSDEEVDKLSTIAEQYIAATVNQKAWQLSDSSAYGQGCGLAVYVSSTTNKIVGALSIVDLQALTGDARYPYPLNSEKHLALYQCLERQFYGSLGLMKDFGRNAAAKKWSAFSDDRSINWYDIASLGILYRSTFLKTIKNKDVEPAIAAGVQCYERKKFSCFRRGQ